MMLTPEQIEQRRRGITATDMARILDGQGLAVWLEKRGLATIEESARMRAGRFMERGIAEMAADELHVEIAPCMWTYEHPTHPWAMATPDFLIASEQTGVLECKNVGPQRAHEFDVGVPMIVEVQATWQAFVTDVPYVIVAAMIAGWDLRISRIGRDENFEGDLLTIAEHWYQRHIVRGEQPEPDGSRVYSKYLAGRFGATKDRPLVSAEAADVGLAYEWATLEKRIAADETRVEQIKQAFALRIGDAAGMDLGSGEILRRVYRPAYTRKAMPAKDVAATSYLRLPRAWGRDEKEGD